MQHKIAPPGGKGRKGGKKGMERRHHFRCLTIFSKKTYTPHCRVGVLVEKSKRGREREREGRTLT
jgi:hypothetical protein